MEFPSMDYPWIFHELQNVSVVVAGTPLGVRKQSRHRHMMLLGLRQIIVTLGLGKFWMYIMACGARKRCFIFSVIAIIIKMDVDC